MRLERRVAALERGSADEFDHLSDEDLKASFLETLRAIQECGDLTSPEWRARIERVSSGGEWFSKPELEEICAEFQRKIGISVDI